MGTLSGETTKSECFASLFKKGPVCTLEGCNFFPYRADYFSEGAWRTIKLAVLKSKQEMAKSGSLKVNGTAWQSYDMSLANNWVT